MQVRISLFKRNDYSIIVYLDNFDNFNNYKYIVEQMGRLRLPMNYAD